MPKTEVSVIVPVHNEDANLIPLFDRLNKPLSVHYGCDFITTAEEGAQLVEMVDHPHFKLILDTGWTMLSNVIITEKLVSFKCLSALKRR